MAFIRTSKDEYITFKAKLDKQNQDSRLPGVSAIVPTHVHRTTHTTKPAELIIERQHRWAVDVWSDG